ncbi:MAG: ATP-dependent DNA helicase RecG [Lachnospiraceae bacterium]|nr:ATP-dependent DNA helicase RecG [Lachnospiraceae bacterium]
MRLTELKGIGEKTERLFGKLNIGSAEDLLNYFPRTYDIYEAPITVNEIDNRLVAAIDGTVMKSLEIKQVNHLQVVSTVIKDKNGTMMKITWFNMPFLRNTVKYSMRFIFRGRINKKNGLPVMEQPELFTLGAYEEKLNYMQPVYSLSKGITNNTVSKAVKQALEHCRLEDYLPADYRERYELLELGEALREIHFPREKQELLEARRRLVFNEFFRFIYNMRKLKEKETFIPNGNQISCHTVSEYVAERLPYELTNAQKAVLQEIFADMASDKTMQRLIQGDVGSGKTILAFLAMLDVAASGRQAALMAPTEVLAEQHFQGIMELKESYNLDITPVLLTGSVRAAEKRRIYAMMESGEADIIIGTHALIQEKAVYHSLALVITDEQHRFGVMQRSAIKDKGNQPHVIVMSATPIPRTLAIILYGDLDISVINELPAKRLSIKNCVVTREYRTKAYRFIEKEVKAGRQAYVICPMVEENDTLEAENVIDYSKLLQKELSNDIVVTYLHGKMKPEEKNDIMRRFSRNEIQVLVSTTVIEVGINVPNATVMMVENAERFGLASLHQLRGRVGRGEYQSYCIFISSSSDPEKLKRLEILNRSNDGFYIASSDLKLRGPGDFFGVRQSGEMEFNLADIYSDGEIMRAASDAVDDFIGQGYELVDKRMNDDIVIY